MEARAPTIDIVISDDHEIFRAGVRKLLEAEPGVRVVAEVADGEETIRVVHQLNPHILLLDLSLPKKTGLEALRELNQLGVLTRTIILTAAIDPKQVVEALQLGAQGIVLKHSALQVLIQSIHCVSAGKHWVDHESVPDLIQAIRAMATNGQGTAAKLPFGITPREQEVIELIVAGYTNKDLARKLNISENTAKHHLTNVFNKLGVSNRLELVLYAIDHRLVGSD